MAKKSKGSDIAQSPSPAYEDQYQAQDDIRTHLQHSQIMKDSKRRQRLGQNLAHAQDSFKKFSKSSKGFKH